MVSTCFVSERARQLAARMAETLFQRSNSPPGLLESRIFSERDAPLPGWLETWWLGRPGGRCRSEIAGDTYIRPQSRLPIRTVAPHNQTLLIPSRPIIQYFAPCLPATGRFASQLSKQQPTFWRTCCRILRGELKATAACLISIDALLCGNHTLY